MDLDKSFKNGIVCFLKFEETVWTSLEIENMVRMVHKVVTRRFDPAELCDLSIFRHVLWYLRCHTALPPPSAMLIDVVKGQDRDVVGLQVQ